MEKLLTVCAFLLALTACSGGGSDESASVSRQAEAPGIAEDRSQEAVRNAQGQEVTFASPENLPEQSRKQVKDGNIQIQVKDYKQERDSILALLKRFEGYVASESESRQSYRLSNSFNLRVPAAHFDALMEAIAKRAEQVSYRNVNVRDVTGEYYDLELRIRNKKELEKRYLDILSKAKSVKEILEIEATLNDVRTEIESMEGSFKLLNNQVEYSTIHLTVFQVLEYKYEPAPKPGLADRILVALQAGWNGFISLLVGLVYIWPLFLISALAVFIILKWRRSQ